MSDFTNLGWGDRLAIINHYQLPDTQATDVFGVSQDELDTARDMFRAGSLRPSTDLDVEQYGEQLSALLDTILNEPTPVPEPTDAPVSAVEKPVTASKPRREPKKRGRKGTKISDAFANVPSEPVELEKFATENSVSVAVLRQSKRFDKTGLPGNIRIRKNKETGVLMISREVVNDGGV